MTYPRFTLPVVLTATAPHIRITYNDASTQNVTLSAATFYPDGSGSGSDLLKELGDELTSDETVGATWTVTDHPDGTLTLAASGGSKTATSLTFLRPEELAAADLGLVAPGGSNTVALTSQAITGLYRRRRCWQPDVLVSQDHREREQWIEIVEGGTGVSHNATPYGSAIRHEIELQKVLPALLFKHYASQTLHAAAAGIAVGDLYATLEQFRDDMISGIVSKTMPRVRFAKDKDAPGTYNALRITDPAQLGTLTAGAVSQVNRAPLYYDVRLLGRATS